MNRVIIEQLQLFQAAVFAKTSHVTRYQHSNRRCLAKSQAAALPSTVDDDDSNVIAMTSVLHIY